MTTFSIPRPSKVHPNRDFWFENKPSGNPESEGVKSEKLFYSSRSPFAAAIVEDLKSFK
jgi:hypothetical protein